HFDAGLALLGVDVDRHAAAVVGTGQRTVLGQDHVDLVGVAAQRLADAVVDDFLGEVVRPRGIRVHTRAFAHGVGAGEDFNTFSVVGVGHSLSLISSFSAVSNPQLPDRKPHQ